jgi:hypothetical protein
MKKSPQSPTSNEHQGSTASRGKKEWQEPKLTFIKPKLTRHGKLEEVTGQFFGAFSPSVDQRNR